MEQAEQAALNDSQSQETTLPLLRGCVLSDGPVSCTGFWKGDRVWGIQREGSRLGGDGCDLFQLLLNHECDWIF